MIAPHYDIVVIGGGVVGCAVIRRFALAGAKVLLLEKGRDILSGASKANSAILHTGFDAPPDSLELELIKAGREEYLATAPALNLPVMTSGALVCAWSEAEAAALEGIAEQARQNAVPLPGILSSREARDEAPGLAGHLVAALPVAGEYLVDPWSSPLAWASQALSLGAGIRRNSALLAGDFDGEWHLRTSDGEVRAGAVINAAGLYGDQVDQCLGLAPGFTIRPRKGQFLVLDKAAARFLDRIILPVPNEITKGIVICPTVFGNILVGPTAEEQEDRSRATVERETLTALRDHAARLVPALAQMPVTAAYAGLRPASERKHYRITSHEGRRCVTLGGIRSTGLSAALGIAQHALRLYEAFTPASTAPFNPRPAPQLTMPMLAEAGPRDWQQPDHGGILCHCEMVTRREIEAVFSSPLPPGDYGGLRRRTRAAMGRCQGFGCGADLMCIARARGLLTDPDAGATP